MLRLKKKNVSFSVECAEPEPLTMQRIRGSCKDVLGRHDDFWHPPLASAEICLLDLVGLLLRDSNDSCHCRHIAGGQSGQQSTV